MPQQCPLVQTQRQLVPMSLSAPPLRLSGLRSTPPPDTRATAAVRSEPILPRTPPTKFSTAYGLRHPPRRLSCSCAQAGHAGRARPRWRQRAGATAYGEAGGGRVSAYHRRGQANRWVSSFIYALLFGFLSSWGTVWGGALEINGNNEANHKAISRGTSLGS